MLHLDVADAAAVGAAADAVVARWGRIDVRVNDAMVSVLAPVKEMEPEEYRRVTEVDYLGYVHGTMAALRHMLPRDRGRDPDRLRPGLPLDPATSRARTARARRRSAGSPTRSAARCTTTGAA